MAKKKVVSSVELSPNEVSKILKDYFEKKGLSVTKVDFSIKLTYGDHADSYGTHVLDKIIVTQEETKDFHIN